MNSDSRYDFKRLFDSLKNKSDSFYNEKVSVLSDKTKRNIDKCIFQYDINGLQCSKNRYLTTEGMIQNFIDHFNERNLLILELLRF
jgi:hypothetical protein